MNFPFYIAKRYLISRKSRNIINIISGVSVIGVMVGTAALIVVLSVFNGFEGLVISLYNSFDPDIKITLHEGKTFSAADLSAESLKKISGVKYVTETLEENALLRYRDRQYIATIKGVGVDFPVMTRLDSMMKDGELLLQRGDTPFAVLGQGVAYYLSLGVHDAFAPLNLYIPKRGKEVSLNPEEAFNHATVFPSGIFGIQQDFDAKYVLLPIGFTRELLSYTDQSTALELGLAPGADRENVRKQVKQIAGERFDVLDRFQQHELLYKIMKSEKWAVYLILTLILLIATFNIIGSLTMLIIDKKQDISILHSLGASSQAIRTIFLFEGLLISMVGAVLGMITGFSLCLLQQRFHLVKLGGSGSFVIDSYPVQMQMMDFVYVFLTVFIIGLTAAWYPAKRLVNREARMSPGV